MAGPSNLILLQEKSKYTLSFSWYLNARENCHCLYPYHTVANELSVFATMHGVGIALHISSRTVIQGW